MKLTIEQLTNIPVYDLGDIVLRPIEYDDYPAVFEYGSDKRVTELLSWSYEKIEDARDSIQSVFLSRPTRGIPLAHAIVEKSTGKMIGTCDFHSVDFEKGAGEIGYCLHADYWGKGYMTKACKQVVAFGFEYLKLEVIEIMHHPKNIGSQKVIERSGFKRDGTIFNKYYGMDIPYYHLTKEEYLTKL